MFGPSIDTPLDRSLEISGLDLFFDGTLGKTLLNTDNASLKIFTRSL